MLLGCVERLQLEELLILSVGKTALKLVFPELIYRLVKGVRVSGLGFRV